MSGSDIDKTVVVATFLRVLARGEDVRQFIADAVSQAASDAGGHDGLSAIASKLSS